MKISVKRGSLAEQKVDALIVGVPLGTKSLRGDLLATDRATGGAIKVALARSEFDAEAGQLTFADTRKGSAFRVVVVGLGAKGKIDGPLLRDAAAVAALHCAKAHYKSAAILLPRAENDCAAFAEGLRLSTYDEGLYRTGKRRRNFNPLQRVLLIIGDGELDVAKEGLRRGEAFAAGTLLARDLVNEPANRLRPRDMAARARALARQYSHLRCTVWGEKRIEKEGMRGILGVGRGSHEESQFIQLEYKPTKTRGIKKIALVGKGLTFDSGGISIKPAAGMELMKFDMGGAAAVLGAFRIIAELKPDIHVLGLIGSAENMPDGMAIKPGDLLEMMNGLTVEVNNTDAEGRLVLADVLYYATKQKPDLIIDAATLTGACMIALGDVACGLMTEDDDLAKLIKMASQDCGELAWRLPLFERHRKLMDGHVADLKNTGPREGGALTAAGFLSCFTEGTRWAHLDIAGTVWTETAKAHSPKGATGFGAQLFYHIAERAAKA
jgi:leucyl aminopeptidase